MKHLSRKTYRGSASPAWKRGSRESSKSSTKPLNASPDLKERDIEKLILDWLNAQPGCKAWKNKSMGTFDPTRGIYRANHSKYSEKGTSDILGIWRGKMLCIEVKSRRGVLRPEQKEFLRVMGELGAIAILARSLEDVLPWLETCADKSRTDHQGA